MNNPAENVKRILALAMKYSAENKREAVANNDFDRSLRIAVNEAKIESYFAKQGVALDPVEESK